MTTIDCDYTVEGNGPALILIHGIGAARDTWRFVIPQLTPHFTVVSYDLRGHGTSPKPNGAFTLDDLVDDLERVRQRSGFDKAPRRRPLPWWDDRPGLRTEISRSCVVIGLTQHGCGTHRGRQRKGLGCLQCGCGKGGQQMFYRC